MKNIRIEYKIRPLMISCLQGLLPTSDGVRMIDEEAIVTVGDEVIAVYKKAGFDLTAIRNACFNLEFSTYVRTSGLLTQTENINASPRNSLRTNKCRKTKLHDSNPEIHQVFLYYAKKIANEYMTFFSKQYAKQIQRTYASEKRVHESYRIAGTPFTSGVINKDTALGYHRDIANTKDGISCMLILKEGLAGGELILPEVKIGFACQDGYILLFDGQKYIHGVTAFASAQGSRGYRYTTVYYNNKAMSLCLPPEQEEQYYKRHLERRTEISYEQNMQK
jgi:hypothetical protein